MPRVSPPLAHANRFWGGPRATVDLRGQRLVVRVRQQRRRPRRATVDQPVRTVGIEAHYPVADDLQGDMAQPRRLRARAAIIDRRQSKQAPGLGRVLAPPRQATEVGGAEIGTKANCAWHSEPPGITEVNHITAVLGNPSRESFATRSGISHDELVGRAGVEADARRQALDHLRLLQQQGVLFGFPQAKLRWRASSIP